MNKRAIILGITACFIVTGFASETFARGKSRAASGIASIYASNGDGYSGARTANGERAIPGRLTAAHRTLPFGTRVRVTNKRNGRAVVVRINDRGPFIRGRVIDLTPAGARALGFAGLTQVSLAVVR
jgi:rare lipoprotein A